jgi:hypothetical protein
MKVLIHYEDNESSALHKSLKITLPKSWTNGPTSNLVAQLVESYNPKFADNQLVEQEMHLCIRQQVGDGSSGKTELVPLCSNAIVVDVIPDRADVYVCHGPSETVEERSANAKAEVERKKQELASTAACTHFGCNKRFPKGGPYPECQHHKQPPVFHETAKYWACCPDKKVYDFDDFQKIPGCETGICTDVKDDGAKIFLGGMDMRAPAAAAQLKSIDDFNKSEAAGGSEAAPVLERLQNVLAEFGIEKELYDQVVEGMKKEFASQATSEAQLLEIIANELGSKLKASMKAIAADQLRIK